MRTLRWFRLVARFALLMPLVLASSCESTLRAGLDPAQTDAVLLALSRAGIEARKEREPNAVREDSYRVMVDGDALSAALAVLERDGLPAEPPPGLSAFFAKQSWVPSASEERARYEAALSGELARSIMAMPNVLLARVHVRVGRADELASLEGAREPGRAAVLVKHRHRAAVDRAAIARLVAGATPGLEVGDVVVVATPQPKAKRPAAPPRSSGLLRALLSVSLAGNAALAFICAFLWSRRRRVSYPVDSGTETLDR